jgi:hypothetical protein
MSSSTAIFRAYAATTSTWFAACGSKVLADSSLFVFALYEGKNEQHKTKKYL